MAVGAEANSENTDIVGLLGLRNAHYAGNVPDIVLLRHGRSEWNDLNLFTGWYDADLAPEGVVEAREAGELLRELDLRVVHTSLLTRAIRTANIALLQAGQCWIPVQRTWRLNERHYGGLTGLNKKETAQKYGAEQIQLWRRSYDVAPPPLSDDSPFDPKSDPRYRDLEPGDVPTTECLADVVRRVRPYINDVLSHDLRHVGKFGGAVLVVAHGNSLRALRMVFERLTPEKVSQVEIPTGIPYRMHLRDDLSFFGGGYLGDSAAAAAAAEAVGRQAG